MTVLGSLFKPLSPLLTAAASAGLAWTWIDGGTLWVPVLVVSVVIVAFTSTAFEFGVAALPNSPKSALTLMELHRVTYWVVGAVGAALVIWVGLQVAGDDLEGSDKELVGVLGSGATAFVTAIFASWSDEKADATLGARIRGAFQAHYVRPESPVEAGVEVHRFVAGSDGERYVHASRFGDISGWGRAARKKRAAGIAAELKSGASNPK